MHTVAKTLLLVIAVCLAVGVSAGAETVESIVAVVGDRVILASDLTNQVQMYMFQAGENADLDPLEVARNMLDQMISDELILMAARQDTSVTATNEEVQAQLDQRIAALASRFPSEEAFIEELRQEGLTKRGLEKRFRPEIRDQILKQKIINNKLSEVTVSRQEVEQFYGENADSLPLIPTQARLAHILIKYKASSETDDSVKALAEQARQIALQGEDFAMVADQFGSGPGGPVGGRIGFIRKDEVVAEFGRAAFNIQPGSISGLVRTEYGWHIIKSHARFRDSVDVSQILFPVVASPSDSARTAALADSLYRELLNGASFKELAKQYSEDDETRATGGEMPLMTVDQLRPEFLDAIRAIDTGQITEPVTSQLGYHILRLLERVPGHRLDLTNDFDMVRGYAQQKKTAGLVTRWVDELKRDVHVDIRDTSLIIR